METDGNIKNIKGFQKGNKYGIKGRTPKPLIVRRARLIKQKAEKEAIAEFKQTLMNALPQISEILVNKALDGDLGSIKEVNDRALGKSIQVNQNDNTMTVKFLLSDDDKTRINTLLLND